MSSDIDKTQRGQQQSQMENYYGKKVWTVCATDVEWLEVELAPKPKRISDQEDNIVQTEQQIKYLNDALDTIMTNNMRQHMKDELRTLSKNIQTLRAKLDYDRASQRFRMKPERSSPKVTVRPYRNATTTITFTCCMTQLPVNLHDATTGHKL